MQSRPRKMRKEEYAISKKVGMAIGDYDMIQDGDRIMVGFSGGKASLTLLRMLRLRQGFAPVDFELLAVRMDRGLTNFDPGPLEDYFKKEGYPFRIEKMSPLKGQEGIADSGRFWCSWDCRKAFFELAMKLGFNKIALAHHLDDMAESILLNLLFQGRFAAMNPKQPVAEGKLTIIRPLAYVEEKRLAQLAKKSDLPLFVREKDPAPNDPEHKMIKDLLARLEKENPSIKKNIFKSVSRIKAEYIL